MHRSGPADAGPNAARLAEVPAVVRVRRWIVARGGRGACGGGRRVPSGCSRTRTFLLWPGAGTVAAEQVPHRRAGVRDRVGDPRPGGGMPAERDRRLRRVSGRELLADARRAVPRPPGGSGRACGPQAVRPAVRHRPGQAAAGLAGDRAAATIASRLRASSSSLGVPLEESTRALLQRLQYSADIGPLKASGRGGAHVCPNASAGIRQRSDRGNSRRFCGLLHGQAQPGGACSGRL